MIIKLPYYIYMRFHSTRCDDVCDSTPKTSDPYLYDAVGTRQRRPRRRYKCINTFRRESAVYRKDRYRLRINRIHCTYHADTISIKSLHPVDPWRTKVDRYAHTVATPKGMDFRSASPPSIGTVKKYDE